MALLTKRETECLPHIAEGLTTKEIAQILSRSPRTVEKHIAHIKEKLHCRNKPQLIAKIFSQPPLNSKNFIING